MHIIQTKRPMRQMSHDPPALPRPPQQGGGAAIRPAPKMASRPSGPRSRAASRSLSRRSAAVIDGSRCQISAAAAVTKGAAKEVPVLVRAPLIDAAVQTFTPGAARSMCSPRFARR